MRRGAFYEEFPATASLLLLILAFFLLEVIANHQASEEDYLKSAQAIPGNVLHSLGADYLPSLRQGEVWRLISHAFLHVGALHIIMNSWVLADLGRLCEPLLGSGRFTVVYITCAVTGGLGSAAYSLATGAIVSAGASGALSGLIGLLLAFSLRHRDQLLRDQLVRWIVYIVLFSILIGNVDHAAHAGGFLGGAAFGYFTPRYVTSTGARLWKIPTWISIALTGAALGFALWHHFSSWSR